MSQLKIILYGEVYSSKNSRRVFRMKTSNGTMRTIVAKSAKAKKQETDYFWQLSDANRKRLWLEMTGNLEYPLQVRFKFFRKTKARFDMINLCQGPMDALVKSKYLPDDDSTHIIPSFLPHEVDKNNPRLEIDVIGAFVIDK